MSEEPAKAEAEGAPPRPGTPKLVLILLVLNLGASGFAVFKLLTMPPPTAAAHGGKTMSEMMGGKTTAAVTGPIIALEPFVVNLDEPGTARYLRCKIQVEVEDKEAETVVNKSVLLVRDVILSHLSGLKLADTLGAQAKETIRAALVKKLAEQLGDRRVRRMFFTEWVVQ